METSLPRSSSESFMYFPLFTRGRWTFQPQVQKSLFLGKSITFSTKTFILKFSLKYPKKWKNHHKKRCVYTRNFMLVLKNLFLFCPKICSKHRTRKLQTCSFFFFFFLNPCIIETARSSFSYVIIKTQNLFKNNIFFFWKITWAILSPVLNSTLLLDKFIRITRMFPL